MGIKIIGAGSYLPEKVISNRDLEKIVATSDEWITKRTGIKKRHISEGEYTFMLGLKAAKKAIQNAKISPQDLDLIIVTTVSADFAFPSMSNVIQGRLNATKAIGIDIACACAGFVYGLDMANRYIKTDEKIKNALVISAENTTKTIDYSDRTTCILFGDGAGAVVVSQSEDESFSYLKTDGSRSDMIYAHLYPPKNYFSTNNEKIIKNSKLFPNKTGRFMFMNGKEVYSYAIDAMTESIEEVCKKANILPNELDYIVPHQANLRIIDAAIKKLKLEKEKVFINISEIGNISSACIPVCLDQMFKEKILKKGDTIAIVGFGAGFIWGSMILTI